MDLPENIQRDHAKENEKRSPNKATSSEVIASAEACIIDSVNTLVKLHKEAQVKLWFKDIIPSYRQPGGAISAGDCFFYSIADCLNQRSGKEEYTIQSLRILCDEYVKDPKNSWIKAENIKDREEHNNYLVRIRFTAEELLTKEKAGHKLGLATWGRPKIEGRIFCEQYDVRIHVIQIQEDGTIHRYLVDRNGETADHNPAIDYQDLNILHIINYHNHFVPLLNSNVYIPKAQRALLAGFNDSVDNLSRKSDNKKQMKGTSIATEEMHAEQVSMRRVQANVYTNSAKALSRVSPLVATSLQRAGILQSPTEVTALLTTATAMIKNLSSEEIVANLVVDEKESLAEVNQDTRFNMPTIVNQQTQINAGVAFIVPKETDVEIKVTDLTLQLKYYYKKYDNEIQRVFGEPIPIGKCFINLFLMQQDITIFQYNDSYDKNRDTFSYHDNLRSAAKRKAISPINIFNSQNKPIKRVLITGDAGNGKSVASQYITTHLWSTKNVWKEKFQIVIRIVMRNLNINNIADPSLENIVAAECLSSLGSTKTIPIKNINSILNNALDTTLIIFDGWNEFIKHKSAYTNTINRLFKERDLNIIVLTRHRSDIGNEKFDAELECIGFTSENIRDYIKITCKDSIRQSRLIKFLESNPIIYNLVHIPIILDIICAIWDEHLFEQTEYVTITEIFRKIVTKLWEIYQEKQLQVNKDSKLKYFLKSKDKIKELLCLLAFKTLSNHCAQIDSSLITAVIKESYNCDDEEIKIYLAQILNAGFLASSNNKRETIYYFIHKSILEYFASLHCVKLFTSKSKDAQDIVISFFIANKYNSYYDMVWCFIAGLLISDTERLNAFFNIFFSKENKLEVNNNLNLALKCLNETKLANNLNMKSAILELIHSKINNMRLLNGNMLINFLRQLSICSVIINYFKKELADLILPILSNNNSIIITKEDYYIVQILAPIIFEYNYLTRIIDGHIKLLYNDEVNHINKLHSISILHALSMSMQTDYKTKIISDLISFCENTNDLECIEMILHTLNAHQDAVFPGQLKKVILFISTILTKPINLGPVYFTNFRLYARELITKLNDDSILELTLKLENTLIECLHYKKYIKAKNIIDSIGEIAIWLPQSNIDHIANILNTIKKQTENEEIIFALNYNLLKIGKLMYVNDVLFIMKNILTECSERSAERLSLFMTRIFMDCIMWLPEQEKVHILEILKQVYLDKALFLQRDQNHTNMQNIVNIMSEISKSLSNSDIGSLIHMFLDVLHNHSIKMANKKMAAECLGKIINNTNILDNNILTQVLDAMQSVIKDSNTDENLSIQAIEIIGLLLKHDSSNYPTIIMSLFNLFNDKEFIYARGSIIYFLSVIDLTEYLDLFNFTLFQNSEIASIIHCLKATPLKSFINYYLDSKSLDIKNGYIKIIYYKSLHDNIIMTTDIRTNSLQFYENNKLEVIHLDVQNFIHMLLAVKESLINKSCETSLSLR